MSRPSDLARLWIGRFVRVGYRRMDRGRILEMKDRILGVVDGDAEVLGSTLEIYIDTYQDIN